MNETGQFIWLRFRSIRMCLTYDRASRGLINKLTTKMNPVEGLKCDERREFLDCLYHYPWWQLWLDLSGEPNWIRFPFKGQFQSLFHYNSTTLRSSFFHPPKTQKKGWICFQKTKKNDVPKFFILKRMFSIFHTSDDIYLTGRFKGYCFRLNMTIKGNEFSSHSNLVILLVMHKTFVNSIWNDNERFSSIRFNVHAEIPFSRELLFDVFFSSKM